MSEPSLDPYLERKTLIVGGIPVNVYSDPHESGSTLPVTVVFALHGRLSHCEGKHVMPLVNGCFAAIRERRTAGESILQKLLIVSLDHRNHGWRKLDPLANEAWDKDATKDNIRHAIDMYAIQTGTARDVSFLIDFLPSYLFPMDEQQVLRWGVIGVSLGGHSAWILLKDEPRLAFSVPIIGCADYNALMSVRIEQTFGPGSTLLPPRYPLSLQQLVAARDPAAIVFSSAPTNPFYGKKILVLSSGADTLVPFSASASFVDALGKTLGPDGSLRVVIEDGAGHRLTSAAVKEAAAFVAQTIYAPNSRM